MKPLNKFLMMQAVQTRYLSSGMDDKAFAAVLSKELKDTISYAHVRAARVMLGIVPKAKLPKEVEELLSTLRQQLKEPRLALATRNELIAQINQYIPEESEDD